MASRKQLKRWRYKMFNNEDILTLAKAGFTAQQIAALSVVGNAPAPKVVEPTQLPDGSGVMVAPITQTPAPAPASAPAPVVPNNPTGNPENISMADVMASIAGLNKTIQAGALLNTQQPQQPTAEDILAQIINPPSLNKEV